MQALRWHTMRSFTFAFVVEMRDFLTEGPGESDFPTDQESWKPVDASETDAEVKKVEEQAKALSTEPTEPKVDGGSTFLST